MATELHAPIFGRVVELLVEPGATVEADEPILTVEALKMRLPVVAPCDGRVREFRVKAGDRVENGMLLAIIDE